MGFEKVENSEYCFKEISSVNIELIEDFSCCSIELDKKLLQMKKHNEGITIVLIDNINNCIIGYCTYTTSGLKIGDQNYNITYPASEIKFFAIDEKYQHKEYDEYFKISDLMLCEIIKRLFEISEDIIYFEYVLLYSVPNAVSFYERNGFRKFSEYMVSDSYMYIDGCIPMFLTL